MGKERKNPVKIFKNLLIKKSGIVDFDGMFAMIPDWARQYHYDCIEKKHTEKKGDTGTYIESIWLFERKVTYYIKFLIEIEFVIRDMNTVVVELPDGTKQKRNQGRFEIVFNSKMQKNYLKNFSEKKGEFSDFLRVVYEKYIGKMRLKSYEDKLEDESRDLLDEIKERLD